MVRGTIAQTPWGARVHVRMMPAGWVLAFMTGWLMLAAAFVLVSLVIGHPGKAAFGAGLLALGAGMVVVGFRIEAEKVRGHLLEAIPSREVEPVGPYR